jgi:hypothetical protein
LKPQQLDMFTKRKAKRPPAPLERSVHILVADALRNGTAPGWWSSHIPSGELRTEETGRLLKRMKTEPGMADFMLLGPGKVRFLELKRKGNKPTAAQVLFGLAAIAADADYAVAYSADEALRILKEWGVLRIKLD